ncbi:MAG: type II toxin-antitoxin system RelB/DinJ family antitoxin [Candidatus Margulisbacteria bacterium]|jgi:DNA-damage-inducible protein J|nr:type II toxin-antitoxin system RelB/DinJ family antitoxin [Candidatus Margulisiibacteriota bacterium]
MSKTASMYLRIDPAVKSKVETIYAHYGLSVTDAVNVFLYQSINVGGMPFNLRPENAPNETTLHALHEGDKILRRGQGRFKNAGSLLRSLKR